MNTTYNKETIEQLISNLYPNDVLDFKWDGTTVIVNSTGNPVPFNSIAAHNFQLIQENIYIKGMLTQAKSTIDEYINRTFNGDDISDDEDEGLLI